MKKITLFKFFLCLFILKIILSFIIPLGVDEVYYLLYARYPDVHYYDHPFMTGWLLRIFTNSMKWEHPFFYRLPFIVASLATTYLIFRMVVILKNKVAAWISVLLYSISIYGSIISGLFVMPDGFMVFFWTLAIYFSVKIFLDEQVNESYRNELLLWFGVAVGCAMASKLHAVFLWVGFIGVVFTLKPGLFRNPRLWVAIFISASALFPMIWWNANNDWLHFSFYANRINPSEGIHWLGLAKELLGEMAYQNPIVWVLIFWWGIIKRFRNFFTKTNIFLLCFSLPMLIFIWALSLLKETLPHWSGPAYVTMIVLAAIKLSDSLNHLEIRRWVATPVVFFILVLILGIGMIHYYPGTIGKKDSIRNFGQQDFTLDMYGWEKSGKDIAGKIKKHRLEQLPIFSDNWFPAAHLDEYVSRNTGNLLFGYGDVIRIHQYFWINKHRGGLPKGDSVLYISVSNYPSDPTSIYDNTFKSIQCLDSVAQYRNGKLSRYFHVFLMSSRKMGK